MIMFEWFTNLFKEKEPPRIMLGELEYLQRKGIVQQYIWSHIDALEEEGPNSVAVRQALHRLLWINYRKKTDDDMMDQLECELGQEGAQELIKQVCQRLEEDSEIDFRTDSRLRGDV